MVSNEGIKSTSPYIDIMTFEIESGISLLWLLGLIDQRRAHSRIHSFHTELFEVNGLIAYIYCTVYVFENHFPVTNPIQIGL